MKFYEFITVTIIFVILLAGILIGGELNKVLMFKIRITQN